MPNLRFSGTANNILLTITSQSDNNAVDSLYVIRISTQGPQRPPWQYLPDGSGGLSTNPAYQTLALWTGASAQLSGIPQQVTYSAEVGVQQKVGGSLIFSPAQSKGSPGSAITPSFAFPGGAVSLDNYLFGVAVGGPINVVFTTGIDPASLANFVSLAPVNNPTATVSVSLTNYDPTMQTASFTPNQTLLPDTIYQISVSSGIADFLHITVSTQSVSTQVVTGVDPTQSTRFVSPYDASKANFLQINSGIFNNGGFPVLRTSFISPQFPATVGSVAPVDTAVNANKNLQKVIQVEVLFYSLVNNTDVVGNAPASVPLTMSTQGSSAGAAAVSASGIDPTTLNIYQFVTGRGLVAVPGSVNNGNGTVTAKINQSGVYILAGVISTNLSEICLRVAGSL